MILRKTRTEHLGLCLLQSISPVRMCRKDICKADTAQSHSSHRLKPLIRKLLLNQNKIIIFATAVTVTAVTII